MCYSSGMTTDATREHHIVGLRELRQNASDIVRRVEAGDTVTVTVSGRPAARIVPTGLAPLSGDLAISTASLAELHFRVLVARDDQVRADRLRRLGLIENQFDALPVDAA